MKVQCSCGDAAGCTYCGIATLSLLGRLPQTRGRKSTLSTGGTEISSEFLEAVTRWLVNRQTQLTQEGDFPMHVDAFPSPILNQRTSSHHALTEQAKIDLEPIFRVQGASLHGPENPPIPPIIPQSPPPVPPVDELQFAGFNGRCNKACDTCYSFWVGGNLAVSIQLRSTSAHHINQNFLRRFSKRSISSTSLPTANFSYPNHST